MSYGYVTVKESTTPSSGGTKGNAVVKTDNLRIRSGAGTSTAQVGLLQTGDRIEITEQKTVSGMLWGRLGDGRGWVCMSYGYVTMDASTPLGGAEKDGHRHGGLPEYPRGRRNGLCPEGSAFLRTARDRDENRKGGRTDLGQAGGRPRLDQPDLYEIIFPDLLARYGLSD